MVGPKEHRTISLRTFDAWIEVAEILGYRVSRGPQHGQGSLGLLLDAVAQGKVEWAELSRLLALAQAVKLARRHLACHNAAN